MPQSRREPVERDISLRRRLNKEKESLLKTISLKAGKLYNIAYTHLFNGKQICLGSPPDSDIVYLLTNHSVYGPGARPYIDYGTITLEDGREFLLFQTLTSRGGKGIRGRLEWFLEHSSYRIQQSHYNLRNAFVTWTQAIKVEPKGKNYVQGTVSKYQLSPAEMVNLKKAMDHAPAYHPKLVDLFVRLHHSAAKFESEGKRQDFYIEAESILNDRESCPGFGCRLLKNLKDGLQRAKSDEKTYFPIEPGHEPKFDNRKLHPPVAVCEYLTGEVTPYSPVAPRHD
ncbi:hypothetical protein ACHAP5_001100 [Fusarium lateritium]